jgi:hypothetical protein
MARVDRKGASAWFSVVLTIINLFYRFDELVKAHVREVGVIGAGDLEVGAGLFI